MEQNMHCLDIFSLQALRMDKALLLGLCLAAGASPALAQLVNYNESLGAYKDMQSSGIQLHDVVSPKVAAKARVKKAIREDRLVSQSALKQADGTLKLPPNQQNLVIRTSYDDVTRGTDGSIRIASPQIDGNVNGNVTLYVEGKEVRNITVLNK